MRFCALEFLPVVQLLPEQILVARLDFEIPSKGGKIQICIFLMLKGSSSWEFRYHGRL